MQTKTQQILSVLQVLSWIIFVGYIVGGVALLVNFILHYVSPGTIINLTFGDIDSEEIKNQMPQMYIFVMSFGLVLSILYIELWHRIINLLTKINLEKPFDLRIALSIEKIAYTLFSIWLMGFIVENILDLANHKINLGIDSDTQYLLMAGIVYIISQVFKRGIEIQEENKLTV